MRDNLTDKAAEYLLRNHKRQRWKQIVSVLAAIVVFVTTYALILPAITLERNSDITHNEYMYPISGDQSAEYEIADSGGALDGTLEVENTGTQEAVTDERTDETGISGENTDAVIAVPEETAPQEESSAEPPKELPEESPENTSSKPPDTESVSEESDIPNSEAQTALTFRELAAMFTNMPWSII